VEGNRGLLGEHLAKFDLSSLHLHANIKDWKPEKDFINVFFPIWTGAEYLLPPIVLEYIA
jgi:hypothetical protein